MRKIAVFTGNRAEYGLLCPVIRELVSDPVFEVFLVVSGSHFSDNYGNTAEEIEVRGLRRVIDMDLGALVGSDKAALLKGFAGVVEKGSGALEGVRPDFLLLAGDRFETFAMAVAAFYSNVPIAHIFGGDLSQGGHLDDSVRHCVTKLAHLHFTTNQDSCNRVLGLGEEPWRVHNVGSPFVDTVQGGEYASAEEVGRSLGLDLARPFVLFTQHPVTTEPERAYAQVRESLEALKETGCRTVVTYPCNDPGSKDIIRAIHEYADLPEFIVRKSLGKRLYIGCLKLAACVAGNSSSGLMETPIFKVPCVNIGSRQAGRLRSANVIDVGYDRREIKKALQRAMNDEAFLVQVGRCENPYGQGGASKRIVAVLKGTPLGDKLLQKKMSY